MWNNIIWGKTNTCNGSVWGSGLFLAVSHRLMSAAIVVSFKRWIVLSIVLSTSIMCFVSIVLIVLSCAQHTNALLLRWNCCPPVTFIPESSVSFIRAQHLAIYGWGTSYLEALHTITFLPFECWRRMYRCLQGWVSRGPKLSFGRLVWEIYLTTLYIRTNPQ